MPADTRVDELEAEIRVVCEPIFDRPRSRYRWESPRLAVPRHAGSTSISRSSRCCKDIAQRRGLGRQLDPDLDLWVTAKPFLERWMHDQIGFPALRRRLLAEAPYIVAALPELPRLLHQKLLAPPTTSDTAIRELAAAQRVRNRLLVLVALLLAIAVALLLHKAG